MSIFITPDGQRLVVGGRVSREKLQRAVSEKRYDTIVLMMPLEDIKRLTQLLESSPNQNTNQMWLNNLGDYREEASWLVNRLDAVTTGDIYVLTSPIQQPFWRLSAIPRAKTIAPGVRFHLL